LAVTPSRWAAWVVVSSMGVSGAEAVMAWPPELGEVSVRTMLPSIGALVAERAG
jgi:hypothetical protein